MTQMTSNIKAFLSLLPRAAKRERIKLFLILLLMALLNTVGVVSIMPFMELVAQPNSIEAPGFAHTLYQLSSLSGYHSFLLLFGSLVFLLIVSANLINAWGTWYTVRYVAKQNYNLSVNLLSTYMYKPYTFFLARNTSELSKNILIENTAISEGILLPALNLLVRSVTVSFIIAALIWV